LPFYAKVPKVTGMQKDDAIDELEKIGFSNITITEKIVTNNSQIGKVLAQNPDSSILISRSLDTPITLQVGIEQTETTP